ncbi:MAG TPA: RNA methyltransferase [Solirubrobacteraceae bacterium]|nr:RNA methyltransferase [Solirubrobacteraceae bacterium]
MTITSPDNAKLKTIRKLIARRRERDHAGLFVAEGEDLLAAADAAGWAAQDRLVVEGSGIDGVEVQASLLAGVSSLGSGTRALGVYEERWLPTAVGPLCVYLHGVHDPGNVGTILRSAEAFGASCVAVGPGCADPFGPKAVRASMGSIFTVPLARATSIEELPGTTVALVPGDGPPLSILWRSGHEIADQIAIEPDLTLLIGAEREGLPAHLADQATTKAHIPIESHSLNAAMAATVALYEVTRMARAR